MTLREYCIDLLVSNLVWPEQAEQIMRYAMVHDTLKPLVGRWDEQAEYFPAMMVNLCFGSVKVVAVEWLRANCPEHIAIQMLEAS